MNEDNSDNIHAPYYVIPLNNTDYFLLQEFSFSFFSSLISIIQLNNQLH